MDQVKFQEFIFEYLEPVTNWSTTYMLTQSSIEQLPLVVTQCLFHASSANEYAQLRTEAAIILQFCVALAMWGHEIFVYDWKKAQLPMV